MNPPPGPISDTYKGPPNASVPTWMEEDDRRAAQVFSEAAEKLGTDKAICPACGERTDHPDKGCGCCNGKPDDTFDGGEPLRQACRTIADALEPHVRSVSSQMRAFNERESGNLFALIAAVHALGNTLDAILTTAFVNLRRVSEGEVVGNDDAR